MRHMHSCLKLGLIGLVGLASTAQAATDSKTQMTSPTGACQAALPNYEGAIRKRPLAINNEGTATAFVTCAFPAIQSEQLVSYQIYFRNRSAAAMTITCTAVNGTDTVGTPVYVVKSTPSLAPDAIANLLWDSLDGVTSTYQTSLSCALPPGGAISTLYSIQLIEVGQ